MEQKDKDLLLRDLCSRVPYGVILNCCDSIGEKLTAIDENGLINHDYDIDEVKSYLFPLSSMTDEEKKEYYNLCIEEEREQLEFGEWVTRVYYHNTIESIDWLNKNHFDYRGLISMGLANDATGLNIY